MQKERNIKHELKYYLKKRKDFWDKLFEMNNCSAVIAKYTKR